MLLALPTPEAASHPLEVVEWLVPPSREYAHPGAPRYSSQPIETRKGIAWLGVDSVSLNGKTLRIPEPRPSESWRSSSVYGEGLFIPRKGKSYVWDPATNRLRVWSEKSWALSAGPGRALHNRRTRWPTSYSSYSSGARYLPLSGSRPVPLARGAVGGAVSAIPPRGRFFAGTSTFASNGYDRTLACLWPDDRSRPRLLPMLRDWSQSFVTGVNSRGDVIGFLQRADRETQGVVWRKSGGIELIVPEHPLAGRRAHDQSDVWMSEAPSFISDEGLVLTREGNLGGAYVEMLYDGRHSMPLKDAVADNEDHSIRGGVSPAADGRTLLMGPDAQGAWYRLRWRRDVPIRPRSVAAGPVGEGR